MQNVSNHSQLIIAKAVARTAAAGDIATPSTLADGEVVVTNLSNKILNDTTVLTDAAVVASGLVQIVQGQGATKPLIISNPIKSAGVITAGVKAYSAAVQQVSTIGFDGTSGNIVNPYSSAADADNTIIVRNTFKSNFYQYSDKLIQSIVGYKVKSTDTILTIADTLAKYCIQDVQKYVNIPYKVERIGNGTKTAATAATSGSSKSIVVVATGTPAVSVAATKGNSSITLSVATSTISSVNFVAGDYIELSGVVYKIVTVGATGAASIALTLDVAYQGTTATIAAASVKFWNSANPTAIGIKFTGLPMGNFQTANRRYEVSKFITNASNFSTTEVVNASTVAAEGTGVYEQIADLEWELQMYEGQNDSISIQIPPVSWRTNVSTSGTYSLLTLEWLTGSGTMSILGEGSARKQLIIAGDISSSTTNCSSATLQPSVVLAAFTGKTLANFI